MMNYINPRVDLAFKKIFGVDENKDLLISLINSIVGDEDQVLDLTLLNPYNPKNFREEKLSILDIKASGQDGKRFNIEIQISDEADYDKRALYYWAKLYTEQLKSSEDYGVLNKAIGIHILNFFSIPGSEKYHNTFRIQEKESGALYFKDLELHTIELKKFDLAHTSTISDIINRVKNSLDMWVAFLTRHDLLQEERKLLQGSSPLLATPTLQKALDVLGVMNFDKDEREAYEDHLKWLRIEANTLKKHASINFEEGIKQGSLQAKIEIAKALLKKGLDVSFVQESTGLTEEELQVLNQT